MHVLVALQPAVTKLMCHMAVQAVTRYQQQQQQKLQQRWQGLMGLKKKSGYKKKRGYRVCSSGYAATDTS
jgi:hypothetical protein